ncbi:hypothetical protein ACJJTC_013935 [Scirpophaga incertulas]
MFTPENQQIEICLLKSNLDKIGDDLVLQNTALPDLDAENDQKCRAAMAALREARMYNAERERLSLENVKLTAKRMQLKQQCEDMNKALQRSKEYRDQLTEQIKREEQDTEILIRKYEDSLRQKADRFRESSVFYKEDEVKLKMEKSEAVVSELESEVKKREKIVEEFKCQLDNLKADVPENLLEILGKTQLDAKIAEVSENYEILSKQRKLLESQRRN